MAASRSAQRFSAKIYKVGINPCVDVPKRVSLGFGRRGYVPVAGTINAHPIRATLVPTGGGRHRLYVNGEMRKATGTDVGDTVHFVLRFDAKSREIEVPRDLAKALRARKGARAAWDGLTPSKRREFLIVILDAKTAATRARRIQRAIDHAFELSAERAAKSRD